MTPTPERLSDSTILSRENREMQPIRHRQLERMVRRLRRWSEALFGGPENVRKTPSTRAVEYIQDSQTLRAYDIKKFGLVFLDPVRERVMSRLLKGIRGYRDMEMAHVHEGESMSGPREVILVWRSVPEFAWGEDFMRMRPVFKITMRLAVVRKPLTNPVLMPPEMVTPAA